jgi:3-oxoacyl-[acyl-carrier protein] reductase
MKLNNKVALVLGAIRRIGKGICLALAKEGINVALTYYDWEERLAKLRQDFSDTGTPHLILRTNPFETDQIQALIKNSP